MAGGMRLSNLKTGLAAGTRLVRGQAGMTLMELMVVMIVLLVVLGGIYSIWFGLQRSYSFAEDDLAAQAAGADRHERDGRVHPHLPGARPRADRGPERGHLLRRQQQPHLLDRRRP